MKFRDATIDDLQLLRKWEEQPHIIAADIDNDWGWEIELKRKPFWREQLIVEQDGQPIAFVQIIDPELEESHYWGDIGPDLKAIDIWIGDLENTGKGYGTQIMKMAIDRCFSDSKTSAILVDPSSNNLRAHKFYEKLGFRYLERRRFNDDLCFVYRLDRTV